jgi:hypothetical protein
MSLLSSFLESHLVPALEEVYLANEPAVQAALVGEIEAFAAQLGVWVNGKLAPAAPAAPAAPVPPVA